MELKKRFREQVCRSIVSEVKPFYQTGKFKSYVRFFRIITSLLHPLFLCVYCIKEDYLHLVKLLTTHICKTTKLSKTSTNEKWAVGEVTRTKARDLVQKVMSQCTVYSASSNLQLGLNEC